jgi:hypothetical protein
VEDAAARALLQRFATFLDPFGACFSRRAQRTAATQYIEGLFNDSERKSMQAMHGHLSDPGSYQALQHFVTDSLGTPRACGRNCGCRRGAAGWPSTTRGCRNRGGIPSA